MPLRHMRIQARDDVATTHQDDREPLTLAEIKAMSTEEVAERMDEVQAAISQPGFYEQTEDDQ